MIKKKYEELVNELKQYDKLAVAFSGGIDSTLLLKAAKDALGNNAFAFTIRSEFTPSNEVEEAENIASFIGAEQIIIPFKALSFPNISKNPKDRCYYCKKEMFLAMLEICEGRGISKIAEGSNKDDSDDYRPGFKAVQELEIISPLLNFTKKEIREIAKILNLPNQNKPATACLASRIPYGDVIIVDALEKIEQAELMLSSFGFIGSRVRLHKTVARIEIPEKDFEKFFTSRKRIIYSLKKLGFPYIALDLEGYKKGSLNKV